MAMKYKTTAEQEEIWQAGKANKHKRTEAKLKVWEAITGNHYGGNRRHIRQYRYTYEAVDPVAGDGHTPFTRNTWDFVYRLKRPNGIRRSFLYF